MDPAPVGPLGDADRSATPVIAVAGARICGVDEAGRGPLAGDVVAAAVILDPRVAPPAGLRDSKLLSARRRAALAERIRAEAIGWAVAAASVEEIDRLNILQASLLAMQRAIRALDPPADAALIDGNRLPALDLPMQAIIGGDARVAAISAASILAKTCRDEMMRDLDARFPQYGFARHFGYPTSTHLRLLSLHGPCEAHRRSFGPVAVAWRKAGR